MKYISAFKSVKFYDTNHCGSRKGTNQSQQMMCAADAVYLQLLSCPSDRTSGTDTQVCVAHPTAPPLHLVSSQLFLRTTYWSMHADAWERDTPSPWPLEEQRTCCSSLRMCSLMHVYGHLMMSDGMVSLLVKITPAILFSGRHWVVEEDTLAARRGMVGRTFSPEMDQFIGICEGLSGTQTSPCLEQNVPKVSPWLHSSLHLGHLANAFVQCTKYFFLFSKEWRKQYYRWW